MISGAVLEFVVRVEFGEDTRLDGDEERLRQRLEESAKVIACHLTRGTVPSVTVAKKEGRELPAC